MRKIKSLDIVLRAYSTWRNIQVNLLNLRKNSERLDHPSPFCVMEMLTWICVTKKSGAPSLYSFQSRAMVSTRSRC